MTLSFVSSLCDRLSVGAVDVVVLIPGATGDRELPDVRDDALGTRAGTGFGACGRGEGRREGAVVADGSGALFWGGGGKEVSKAAGSAGASSVVRSGILEGLKGGNVTVHST